MGSVVQPIGYLIFARIHNFMYICICNPVTDSQLRRAISEGCQSLHDLQANLGVATSCGRCAESACAILQAEVSKRAVSRRYLQKSA